jgi:hypothetical protein
VVAEPAQSESLAVSGANWVEWTCRLHSGIDLRDLSPKGSRVHVYECRVGLALRLIFTRENPLLLYFHMIGTHDDVRRFLKSFL